MRWPLLWGGLASLGFYAVVNSAQRAGHIASGSESFIGRYFASHPVEYITTTMFFVGIAAVSLKFFSLSRTQASSGLLLGAMPAGPQPIEECQQLLSRLAALPAAAGRSKLAERLRDAIQYVQRKRSAEDLEDHLHHLEDQESTRVYNGGSLVRIIIATIPILGFLGTVVGMTKAIAGLDIGDGGEGGFAAVVGGLSVAFDTTTLALALSIVLMFASFFVGRKESRLQTNLQDQTERELVGRFEQIDTDPETAHIRRMADEVVQATRDVVTQQAELWQSTIDAAHQRWSMLSGSTEKQMATALTQSLTAHAAHLQQTEVDAQERTEAYWQRAQEAFQQQQEQLTQQNETMLRVVDATGRVMKLEDALNQNLNSLAQSGQFDKTVTSLAAAIQLLSARLGDVPQSPQVSLADPESSKSTPAGHAA